MLAFLKKMVSYLRQAVGQV